MHHGGGDGTGCFVIKVWVAAAQLVDMWVAGFRQSRYLDSEGDLFAEDETKIMSRKSCVKWAGSYFSELLFESDEEKFRVKSFAVIHEEMRCNE